LVAAWRRTHIVAVRWYVGYKCSSKPRINSVCTGERRQLSQKEHASLGKGRTFVGEEGCMTGAVAAEYAPWCGKDCRNRLHLGSNLQHVVREPAFAWLQV
jgi:hypothetical protein